MRTNRPLAIAVVVLGVLVVGSTAATFDDSRTASTGTGGVAEGSGSGNGLPVAGESGVAEGVPLPGWVVEHLFTIVLGVGMLGILALALYRVWTRGLEGLLETIRLIRDVAGGTVLYVLVLAALVVVGFDIFSSGVELPGGAPPEVATDPIDGGGSSSDGTETRSVPFWSVAAGLGVLAVLVVLFRRGRDGTADSGSVAVADDESEREEQPAPNSAGMPERESVSDVPASNPVYRAWREMASRVTRGETLTANEVARAATEEGLDRDAVRTLTALFREVRYGREPVTADRQRRAQSALDELDGTGGRDE